MDSSQALDEAWVREHVAEHVERVVYLGHGRSSATWPEATDAWNAEASALRDGDDSSRQSEDFLCARLPWFALRVVATDAAFFEGLPEVFGTTAYDVWWDDPAKERRVPIAPALLNAWTTFAYRPPLERRPVDERLRLFPAPEPTRAFGLPGAKSKGYVSVDEELTLTSHQVLKSASYHSGLATVPSGVYFASTKRVTRVSGEGTAALDAKSGVLFKGSVTGAQAIGDEVAIGTTGGVSVVRGDEVVARVETPKALKDARAFFARSRDDVVLAGPKGVARLRGEAVELATRKGGPTAVLPLDEERTLIVEDELTWLFEDGELTPFDTSAFGRPVASTKVGGARLLVSAEGVIARWDGDAVVDARTYTVAPTRVSSAVADGDALLVADDSSLSRVSG